jgi:6-phosphofructokinase 1
LLPQDCCLIPESPFYLEGKGGLLEFIEKRLKDNGHMVIVVAEGAGQDLIAKSMNFVDTQDASGNKLLLDVGLWLSQKIKVRLVVQIFVSLSMCGQNIICPIYDSVSSIIIN